MTPHRRAQLEQRANPPDGVDALKRRMTLTVLVAIGLALAQQTFPAVLVLLSIAPTAVRYLRRELAVGALLADAGRARRIPMADLREQ